MNKDSKIYVAGHNGMVGSAIVRKLKSDGYTNLLMKGSSELDLRRADDVNDFFSNNCPDYVFLAAAKVGGILSNDKYKADFLYDNLMIQNNVIHAAHVYKCEKLLFLGSSCIYPKYANQPITEDSLLTGLLEPTNEPYAVAKIAGIKLCQSFNFQYGTNFISAMPTNLFGPNDNYDLQNSHVLPALVRKFHEAKENRLSSVVVWGSGRPKREFLHVDDLAEACVYLMNNYNQDSIINIGTGEDISIKDLAVLIKDIVGYNGDIVFDQSKPDGTPRKLLNVDKITEEGWKAKISLKSGIISTYQEYINQLNDKAS
ncbi:GDP-L-fucose synthase [Fulvivirga ligni]|uniref:GDP-L-fucose synthase n=1 Tax=Fulvivirga ligni TaxID=2904246 RepID=UPI001F1C8998|nr:GDP-L-fucose synthase [Fulvivirga ligni]UII22659.1 GDP-L-fucose synthase [Fulvivirga ligni]